MLRALFADVVRETDGDLAALAQDCREVIDWMTAGASLDDRLAGSVPFLAMAATAVAGLLLQRQVAFATGALAFSKPVVARYFAEHLRGSTCVNGDAVRLECPAES